VQQGGSGGDAIGVNGKGNGEDPSSASDYGVSGVVRFPAGTGAEQSAPNMNPSFSPLAEKIGCILFVMEPSW